MRKFILPVGAGVVVFGVVTAFAATLTVNSDGLAAGNGTVDACNTSADVTYDTALATGATNTGKYVVTDVAVTSVAACSGKSYKITLLDANDAAVGSQFTGTLDADGAGGATITDDSVLAHDVEGVAVVVTG